MLIKLTTMLIAIVLIYLLVSQVTLPALTGKPLFPMFRKSRNKSSGRLAEAKAEIQDLQIQEQAARTEIIVEEKRAQVEKLESTLIESNESNNDEEGK